MEKPIKILNVINSLGINGGGPSRSVPNQSLATLKAGLNVGIVFLNRNGKLSPEANQLKIDVKKHPITSLFSLKELWQFISQYDIIHIHGIWSPFCHLAVWFARLQKKPIIIAPRGMLEPWALKTNYWKKIIGYKIYQKNDLQNSFLIHTTAVSEAKNIRLLGIKTPIAVIPNGVICPSPMPKPATVPKKNRRLLFLSRIHPKKGILELLRAVAQNKKTFINHRWLLTIAGPDENGFLSHCQKEAKNLDIENLVEWRSSLEGKAKWALYRSAQAFILPTHSENFGLVVAEALAAGVPVLTTHGAPWNELNKEKCGWWIPLGQAELNKCLTKLLTTSPTELKAMGRRGKILIQRKYAWPAIGKQMVKTYQWILKIGPQPKWVIN